MPNDIREDSRFLTIAVVLVSLSAILYFGYQAILEGNKKSQPNPFEYNIEHFKDVEEHLVAYTEVTAIPLEFNDYFGIAIDEKDRLYVSVDQSIQLFSAEHRFISSFEISKPAYCLESDRSGLLYLGMADHIEIYDSSGNRKSVWTSLGDKAIITSIAVSKDFVFAADAGNLVVWKYDMQGNIVAEIGRKDESVDVPGYLIPSPYFDVDLDPDGFLWAANTGRHSLENYTKEGGIRTSWGYAGMSMEGFSGCCNPSHFTFLKDGSFVTAEKGLVRVKVYDRLGKLKSIVAEPKDFIEGTRDLDLAVDSKQRVYILDQVKEAVRIFSLKDGG